MQPVLKLSGMRGNVVPPLFSKGSPTSGRPGGTLIVMLPFPFITFAKNCHQKPDFMAKVHQIQFRLWLRPRPRWGSLRRSPRPPSWLGRGTPPPQTSPSQRLRRLDLGAYGTSLAYYSPPLLFPQFKHCMQLLTVGFEPWSSHTAVRRVTARLL